MVALHSYIDIHPSLIKRAHRGTRGNDDLEGEKVIDESYNHDDESRFVEVEARMCYWQR